MNIVLWIVQLALALIFIMAGVLKVFQYGKAKESMSWVNDVPKGFVIFLGFVEILGAMGLVLPIALGILPFLTPLAALALAIIMVFAAIFHYNRKEFQIIPINIVLLFISFIYFNWTFVFLIFCAW